MTQLSERQIWFDMLYRKYRTRMLHTAMRHLGDNNPQIIDDIVQDVFRRALEKYDKIKDHPCIEFWLLDAVRLQILTELKKAHYKWETESLEIFSRTSDDIPDGHKRSNQEPYTEDHYFADFLSALPKGLHFDDVRILYLYDIAGYTHKEISKMLGFTEISSRARLHRARERYKILKEKEEISKKLSHSNPDKKLINRRCKDD